MAAIAAIVRPREQSFQKTTEAESGCLNMSKDWLSAVQDAIHETDPQMAEVKIRMAEAAIFSRIRDFIATAEHEEQALFDALGAIRQSVPIPTVSFQGCSPENPPNESQRQRLLTQ